MKYKVMLPTAGTGSRLGGMTKYLNKSLVSIGSKPALSRIIEMFPEDTDFVIAVGYKGELVKEYLSLAYPEKNFQFVEISPFEGEGSGLGLTLLTCKDYLQEPFVFCSCDTLVDGVIPAPDHNWMGYDHRDNREQYRTIHLNQNGGIKSIDEKGMDTSEYSEAYIGLAGIYDWEEFWRSMVEGEEDSIRQGEAYGLKAILPNGIVAQKFKWFDTGVAVELEVTRRRFEEPDAPNILEKANEAIWFLKDKVIKFSDDVSFIHDRVRRAEMLKGFVPEIVGFTKHMYCYSYVKGNVISKCVSRKVFEELLMYSRQFWQVKTLDDKEMCGFKASCMKFYRGKTCQRVEQFYRNFDRQDNAEIINDVPYPPLKELLDSVDWDYVSDGLPGRFHGDYHFENIVYDREKDVFRFLDWRQSFGDSLETGDIYYDLAKLNHGLIICHEIIAKELYHATWSGNEIRFDFNRKQILVECEEFFYKWLRNNGYDVTKVRILTALIFLNICALHHAPYVFLLYGLGKQMLHDTLREMYQKEGEDVNEIRGGCNNKNE